MGKKKVVVKVVKVKTGCSFIACYSLQYRGQVCVITPCLVSCTVMLGATRPTVLFRATRGLKHCYTS